MFAWYWLSAMPVPLKGDHDEVGVPATLDE